MRRPSAEGSSACTSSSASGFHPASAVPPLAKAARWWRTTPAEPSAAPGGETVVKSPPRYTTPLLAASAITRPALPLSAMPVPHVPSTAPEEAPSVARTGRAPAHRTITANNITSPCRRAIRHCPLGSHCHHLDAVGAEASTQAFADCNISSHGQAESPGDQHPLHLRRPFADGQDPGVAVMARHVGVVHEAVAAVEVAGLVGDLVGQLGRHELRHRRLPLDGTAGVEL